MNKFCINENGNTYDADIHLVDGNDKKKAQEVMAATGIPNELDAVIMVFRRYQPDFLKWWSGDKSAAPTPLSEVEITKSVEAQND